MIITHLHYDHAGGLAMFRKARLHIQEREMSYATGPCMCSDFLRAPYTAQHVCEIVREFTRDRYSFTTTTRRLRPGSPSIGWAVILADCSACAFKQRTDPLCLRQMRATTTKTILRNDLSPWWPV
ncbi:MBL fold metallo-hydrolase [Bradyrhizobium sp. USDA 336]|uniref:MBL fold metallo-hydrolase n=1 Tax=Bradyrhizobium sp. USDA 336 TaxID=3156311 RepID=UPI00384BEE84